MKKRLLATIPVLLVVFLCSFPVFANSQGALGLFGQSADLYAQSGYQTIYSNITLTYFYPYRSEYQAYDAYFDREFKVLGYYTIYNTNNQDFKFSYTGAGNSTSNKFFYHINTDGVAWSDSSGQSQDWQLREVKYLSGQLAPTYITGSDYVVFELLANENDGSPTDVIVPANSNICCYFEMTFGCRVPNTGTLYNPNFTTSSCGRDGWYVYTGTYGDYYYNFESYIPDIYDELVSIYNKNDQQLSVLQQILSAYNSNVPASQDVTNESSSLETQSNTIHNQETSYYTQTNTALSNTGLSNYTFTPNVIGGLGIVKDHFTYVWNKLGNYNVVFTFSLTLGIALLIIRHVRPIRRRKEE